MKASLAPSEFHSLWSPRLLWKVTWIAEKISLKFENMFRRKNSSCWFIGVCVVANATEPQIVHAECNFTKGLVVSVFSWWHESDIAKNNSVRPSRENNKLERLLQRTTNVMIVAKNYKCDEFYFWYTRDTPCARPGGCLYRKVRENVFLSIVVNKLCQYWNNQMCFESNIQRRNVTILDWNLILWNAKTCCSVKLIQTRSSFFSYNGRHHFSSRRYLLCDLLSGRFPPNLRIGNKVTNEHLGGAAWTNMCVLLWLAKTRMLVSFELWCATKHVPGRLGGGWACLRTDVCTHASDRHACSTPHSSPPASWEMTVVWSIAPPPPKKFCSGRSIFFLPSWLFLLDTEIVWLWWWIKFRTVNWCRESLA